MSNDELPVSAIQRRIAKQLMLSDDFAALILRWFGDTAVGLDISDDDRSWIAGLLDTGGHRELLMPIAKRMAIHSSRMLFNSSMAFLPRSVRF
jgi:hypothetical protein